MSDTTSPSATILPNSSSFATKNVLRQPDLAEGRYPLVRKPRLAERQDHLPLKIGDVAGHDARLPAELTSPIAGGRTQDSARPRTPLPPPYSRGTAPSPTLESRRLRRVPRGSPGSPGTPQP